MAKLLEAKDLLWLLQCPVCYEALDATDGQVICRCCRKRFAITRDILELLDETRLDAETLRELRGNTVELTPEHIAHMARKDEWSRYYTHCSLRKFDRLVQFIKQARLDVSVLIALGAGTGYEIKALAKRLPLRTVYCSDLALTRIAVAPYTLASLPIQLGLFTSDLQNVTVSVRHIPILIYEALHHTSDMHISLEKILKRGYMNVLFCEPTDNWLISALEKRGLARRVEYSGVKPGRLDIKRLRRVARDFGYALRVSTFWEFPEDYFRRIFGKSRIVERVFLLALDIFSLSTAPFRFGNSVVVHLQKH